MTPSSDKAATPDGPRDRPGSDDDGRNPPVGSKSDSFHDETTTTVGIAGMVNEAVALNKKATRARSSRSRHRGRSSGMQRSKPTDLRRHRSTTVHKNRTKWSHRKIEQSRWVYSPGIVGHRRQQAATNRSSPSSSPRLKGKLWIRPCVAPMAPVVPLHSRSNLSKEYPGMWNMEFRDFMASSALIDAPAHSMSCSSSPSLTSIVNEMMRCSSPISYGKCQRKLNGEPARIIFGESGRPITKRSRLVFE